MKKKTWNINLYILNFALLFSHEIDSAFWREWDLFGIPGGIQGFLVVNFLLLLVALFGFKQLLQGARSGYMFSLLLAASGVFAFSIHRSQSRDGRGQRDTFDYKPTPKAQQLQKLRC
jgi:hypothetical protein